MLGSQFLQLSNGSVESILYTVWTLMLGGEIKIFPGPSSTLHQLNMFGQVWKLGFFEKSFFDNFVEF